jgi:hypothetical protein
VLGAAVPILCAERIRSSKSLAQNRYFLGVVLFELFFFIPLGAYLYYFHPAWSLMYFVDPAALQRRVLILGGLIALAAYLAAAMGGYLLAAGLIRKDKLRLAAGICGGVALALGLFSLIAFRQLSQVGTFADWQAVPPKTIPLVAHRIGLLIGLDGAVAAFVLLLMLKAFRQGPDEEA